MINEQDCTEEQWKALIAVYDRQKETGQKNINDFLATASVAFGDCIMVPFAGMMLGIEKDGYTHS